ncbi:hypothetical protein ACKVMT_00465 [Halobacteriales archaeon Cl-PHB]
MASESTDDGSVTVSLPPELDDWLEEQAAELGLDRETVLVQLLASYRATAVAEGDRENGELPVDAAIVRDAIEPAVDETVEDALAERFDSALDDRIETAVSTALEDRNESAAETVDQRISTVRSEFQDKIADVRDRVIQVKQEADAKAPADHTHEELDRVDDIGHRVVELEESVEVLESEFADLADVQDEVSEEFDAELSDLQERVETVAWVVSDLREAFETDGEAAALERIKRSAAQADVSRAKCESCGNGVQLALLAEPECPHCQATVTNVEPSTGFFGKPQLLVASQLESGEHR